MAIEIVFAPPRYGKTAYMTHMANLAIFDKQRIRNMTEAIAHKNANGFRLSTSAHPLVANFDIVSKKFRYTPRKSRRINPYRLGYANPRVDTHFLEPFSVVCITEGQVYFNSRMSMYYPDWQSRWMEQHGHNNYDIYIDVQRVGLIDRNIRELARFTEILSKQTIVSGRQTKTVWRVRKFETHIDLERYVESGRKDTSTYIEETVVADYDVHQSYNHQMCKPKFYEGHMTSDFDTREHEPCEETFDGYIKFLHENDDELPVGFYTKKGVA